MKRNLFNHIPTIIIVLFFCTFSFFHLHSANTNFNAALYSELTQSQTKSVHAPNDGVNSSFENLFENETEDETKTEFDAALPMLSLSQSFTAILFSVKSFSPSSYNEGQKNTQDYLYLIVRSIRI